MQWTGWGKWRKNTHRSSPWRTERLTTDGCHGNGCHGNAKRVPILFPWRLLNSFRRSQFHFGFCSYWLHDATINGYSYRYKSRYLTLHIVWLDKGYLRPHSARFRPCSRLGDENIVEICAREAILSLATAVALYSETDHIHGKRNDQ